MRTLSRFIFVLVSGLAWVVAIAAQGLTEQKEPMNQATQTETAKGSTQAGRRASRLLQDFVDDQQELWISPKKVRFEDTTWLVPLSGFTAGLFVTDSDVSRHLSHDPKTINHYNRLSNAGVAALVGGAGSMWLLSHYNHKEHWQETGVLSGEAALHSLLMTEAFKYSFRRERPYQGDGAGQFFQPGGTSFPSAHSAVAWSVASVIAHEYHGPLTKILAYGAAGLVSYWRIRAEKHFSSDVLMGALLGQLAAHKVYTKHHDVELGGDEWNSPAELFYEDGRARPGFIGSPYVPLDSWIYPVFERLAGMGLMDTAFAGMRPWTRLACAQMVSDALARADQSASVASDLLNDLQDEFRPELGGGADHGETIARLESVYTRGAHSSGMPLTDGFNFAQTQINDFGRPYAQGWNSITGFSFYTTSGPWSGYIRGELQTAPATPALPLSARQFVTGINGLPQLAPGNTEPSVQQFQLLEAYVGLTVANWQISFGRQSLDWGPGDGGSLMFSNNARPIDMFRINRVTPLHIPLVSRFLGPFRAEIFFGELTGHHFVGVAEGTVTGSFARPLADQPYVYGGRFSFKPTRNFEFGLSQTTIFGGPGVPLTLGTFKHSVFGFQTNGPPGSPQDPGDRRSGMDWTYRLPLMRNWVTFYGDAFADDQYSPIAYWDRSAIRGGLYFSHLPKLPKLDLRVEGIYTDVPAGGALCCGFFYRNLRFRDGYTNDGFLLGSWIGRDGQGAQAWTNYWFNAKDRLQFYFRHQKVSQQFAPGGGSLTDVGTRVDYWFRQGVGLTGTVQYERWLFPVIQPGPERNIGVSIAIQFQPRKIFKPSLRRILADPSDTGGAN